MNVAITAEPRTTPRGFRIHPSGAKSTNTILEVRGLCKSYRRGTVEVPVLRGLDLQLNEGEFTAIIGQSGSGKSTLLHLLATLDSADEGEIFYEGNRIDNLSAAGRDVLRNHHFGMVFQFYHLLPELTALENVMLPLLVRHSVLGFWRHKSQLKKQAIEILERMQLAHRLKHRPSQMSGGEMQRVAIARALLPNPRVLFADEPTGNLDRETGDEILKLLSDLRRDRGITIVMVTHDQTIASRAERTVRLAEGRVCS